MWCDLYSGASNFLAYVYVMFFALIALSLAVSWHGTLSRVRTLVRVFGVPMLAKATGSKPKQD